MPLKPVRIYVMWHPETLDGNRYARALYSWFRGDPSEVAISARGIPVRFRSEPAQAGGLVPRPIHPHRSELTVLVPLIDENFVADPHWRDYLEDATAEDHGAQHRVLVYPVALSREAYNLPGRFSGLNFLRVDSSSDPLQAHERTLERRITRVRRQLTQALARLLIDSGGEIRPQDAAAPPPLTVFISHAKADGRDIAAEIRDAVQRYGQVRAFFDENDLDYGRQFTNVLEESAGRGTAAMIAVLTEAYPKRPWCLREIEIARRFQRHDSEDHLHRQKPLYVVDCLDRGLTRNVAEFGAAPMARWRPEQIDEILDVLLRELLLRAYHARRAQIMGLPKTPRTAVLDCVPDRSALLGLLHDREPSGASPEARSIAYDRVLIPSAPLTVAERQRWQRLCGAEIDTYEGSQ